MSVYYRNGESDEEEIPIESVVSQLEKEEKEIFENKSKYENSQTSYCRENTSVLKLSQNGNAVILNSTNIEENEEMPDETERSAYIYLDDILSVIKFGRFHWKMMLLTCGGYFSVCAEMMLFIFLSEPVKKEWNVPDMLYPLFPVISGAGGILGGFVFGIVSDKYGRKTPFIVSTIILAVFGVASPFAPSFPLFILIRTWISVGEGGLEALVYVLLLEFLPRKKRGTCLVAITFFGALGAVFAGGLAWWLLSRYGWKTYVGACAAPAVLMVPLSFLLTYESPRFLLVSGRKKEALKVLKEMAKQNQKTLPSGKLEYEVSEHRGRILELFSPSLRSLTIVISSIWVLQCLGYWGVTMFLPEYMLSLGIDPYFNMFTVFIGELPGMVLAMILIEPHMLGRIKCLRFFSIFTFIFLIVFAFVDIVVLKSVAVVVCYFFMVPLYSILNTITPELYPTEVRTTAVAFVNILIEIPALVTPFLSASLLKTQIMWLYPVVWAGCFFLQSAASFCLKKETAGKNLIDSKNKQSSPELVRLTCDEELT